jgi:hypothetical protein
MEKQINILTIRDLDGFRVEFLKKANREGYIAAYSFMAELNGKECSLVLTTYGKEAEQKRTIYLNGRGAPFVKTIHLDTELSSIGITNVKA